MIGKTLGHYRIVDMIGKGGMGEVFLAEDTSLRRRVALKFLPSDLPEDAVALKRLLREARSAAALDHPYICHINEVAEADGRDFIVMEYVEGESLRSQIAKEPLPLAQALQVGIEVAEALEAAHAKGIVHRDIKPENIMLTRTGHAKVMDFGLAKQVGISADAAEADAPTATLLTLEGSTVGTLAYVAPEQLRGQGVDARSDVWALGATLYEMATGARPFQGQSGFEVSSAILNRPPVPLPPAVPAALGAVIMRCLEKDPARRYQSARELRAALEEVKAGTASALQAWRYRLARRRWVAAAAGAVVVLAALAVAFGSNVFGIRTRVMGGQGAAAGPFKLAVLPFENLTGDPEQEYLSDGFTQEMIAQLGRLHPRGLSVIARTSVMRYKKNAAPPEQIARELGVGYILGGSCRREHLRLRISVELIDARNQTQLWTETYERELSGIMALQVEVARRVAAALAIKLLPSAEARLAKARTVDPEAYEAYLKGIKARSAMTRAGFDEAERLFGLASAKDPGYAAPWAGLAGTWTSRVQLGMVGREEGVIKAKSAALKALALDDEDAEARRVLAGILTWLDWDWPAAEQAWNRLFEIEPDSPAGLPGYAHFLMVTGRLDEALARSARAMELDPYNVRTQSFHAIVLMHARRFDEAIALAQRALSAEPGTGVAHSALTISLFRQGRYDELLAVDKETWAKDAELLQILEAGGGGAGYPGTMAKFADVQASRYGKPGGRRGIILAIYYARAGDKDRVIQWLEKAYEEHDNNVPYMGSDPIFDLAHDDPRFKDLLRRIGIPG